MTNNSQVISVSVIKDNVSDSNSSLNDRGSQLSHQAKPLEQKQMKRTESVDEPKKEET